MKVWNRHLRHMVRDSRTCLSKKSCNEPCDFLPLMSSARAVDGFSFFLFIVIGNNPKFLTYCSRVTVRTSQLITNVCFSLFFWNASQDTTKLYSAPALSCVPNFVLVVFHLWKSSNVLQVGIWHICNLTLSFEILISKNVLSKVNTLRSIYQATVVKSEMCMLHKSSIHCRTTERISLRSGDVHFSPIFLSRTIKRKVSFVNTLLSSCSVRK